MKVIVITQSEEVENEAALITAALEAGAHRVHIRKPEWSLEQTRELIDEIPSQFRAQLTLHDNFELCSALGVDGIQLNGRNPEAKADFEGVTSKSCHSINEIQAYHHLDYVTLSPIFDSISKQGYGANFSEGELTAARESGLIDSKVIALGGIQPQHIPYLHSLGFGGVALLGYIWQDSTIEGVKTRTEKAVKTARMCHNFSLQYITHRNSTLNDIDSSKLALEGGCKWVQLRMKGYSDQEFIDNALKLGKLCDSFGATFLLNDKAHLVNECNAHGVHLGKNDIAPSKAREMLGDKAIIGGTANTCQDIDYLVAQGVDYIGLGPFRFTTTKDNLSPVLGFEGYKAAIAHCKDKGYTTPIVAIGGITIEDINKIMSCGVSGIALSGTILNAQDSTQTTREIMTILADKRK